MDRGLKRLIEIRTYTLECESADRFLSGLQEAIGLMREHGMDTVAFPGARPSL